MNKYDIIIIGAGPAGLTAAVYACRAGKSVLILEGGAPGGQISTSHRVDNFPATPGISGMEFSAKLQEQAESFGAEVEYDNAVSVTQDGEDKIVTTGMGGKFACRALIIACGLVHRTLGVEGEEALVGSGVSYCAVCDGGFFRGSEVAVVGGGNTALEDAEYLSNICSKVYLIHRRDSFRGESAAVEALKAKDNVVFVLDSVVTKIRGGMRLEGIDVKNVKTGEESSLDVAGLFPAVGQIPQSDPFKGLVETDDSGYIVAGEDCLTGVPGVFAAGDCRTKSLRQLVTAASDGAVAATAAAAWCDR